MYIYIYFNGTITVRSTAAQGATANNVDKKVVFKNYVPFINCISRINNTQVDDMILM